MRAVALLTVALASCWAMAEVRAGENMREAWERRMAILRSLPEQFRLERQISLEQIAAGTARGEWTDAEAAEARDWLQSIYSQPAAWHGSAMTGLFVSPVNTLPLVSANIGSGASRPVTILNSTLYPRCRALLRQKEDLSWDILSAADRAAAEVWIEAQRPADLQPLQRIMEETFAEFKESLLHPRGYSSPGPSTSTRSTATRDRTAVELFGDTYSVIHPEEPFLFPDPVADSAGFRAAWRYYYALRRTPHGFFDEPAVSRHIEQLRQRYQANAESAWAALSNSVIENAPTSKIAAALERVAQLPPLAFPSSASGSPPPAHSATPSDFEYRLIAKPYLNSYPDTNEVQTS